MVRILVGTPTVTADHRFLPSLSSFLEDISKRYKITHRFIYNKPIYEAQNLLAEEAIVGDYDYLLMIEDDHWGFEGKHLDALLQSGKEMIGIPYYSRHFPYLLTAMKYASWNDDNIPKYEEVKHLNGTHPVDLIGFGFTLFKTSLLKQINSPIFYPLNLKARATDQWFCMKIMQKGIQPFAIFDWILPHRDITKETKKLFLENRLMNRSGFARNMWALKLRNTKQYSENLEERKKKALSLSIV